MGGRAHLVQILDVESSYVNLRAVHVLEILLDLLELGDSPRDQDDLGATLGHAMSGRLSDSRARSGDQNDLVLDRHCLVHGARAGVLGAGGASLRARLSRCRGCWGCCLPGGSGITSGSVARDSSRAHAAGAFLGSSQALSRRLVRNDSVSANDDRALTTTKQRDFASLEILDKKVPLSR